MLFSVEYDRGHEIIGYVVPDGVTGSVNLVVKINGLEIFELVASDIRIALVESGRHETGACGFRIASEDIPSLEDFMDLEIRDRDNGVLIYRRPNPKFWTKKVLRLETHMLPLWRLDNSISKYFQYSLQHIENFGRETTTQLFLLNHVSSVYLSGRILYRNYAFYIDTNFECIAALHDPYEELAERLYILTHLRKSPLPHLGARDSVSLIPAIGFVETMRIDDEKSVHDAFKHVPDEVVSLLADPLVRQLTTTVPGEPAGRNGTAAALDILSSFAIVGLRSESDKYIDACAEFLNIENMELPPVPRFPQVSALADMLRRSKHAGYLIEKDRELYNHVAHAFQTAKLNDV